jgi:D-tyrosyl-tRNA(Tyr) deacylase
MKLVIQRVRNASVAIDGKVHGKIQQGYMILVGLKDSDNEETVQKMAEKTKDLRIFEDENGKTNLNLEKVNGEVLSISQFTLYADCHKGNRPSFTDAGEPVQAEKLYHYYNECLRSDGIHVEEGIFGADMKVELLNDGPFTILLDSDKDIHTQR